MIALVAALAAVVAPAPPVSFAFDRYSVEPGERVTVHVRNVRSPRPVRVYLVPTSAARKVRSRYDARLHYVASVVARRGRGMVSFEVPPLDSGRYTAWCAGCRSARSAVLSVTMPPATGDACPVTVPNGHVPRGVRAAGWRFHGNGVLAAAIRSARYPDPDGDGLVGDKMIWITGRTYGALEVRYRRIDAGGPTVGTWGISGTLSGFAGRSWASRMSFTEGCWKITGRVDDIALSFIHKVTIER